MIIHDRMTNLLSSSRLSSNTQILAPWYKLPYQKKWIELYVNDIIFSATTITVNHAGEGLKTK